MTRTAIYTGSFDPVTNGHVDIACRAARLFDRLVVAVGAHHTKNALFSAEDRCKMIEAEIGGQVRAIGADFVVTTFAGLAVDAAREAKAIAIIRGLRDGTDFDYETQMAGMNGIMVPDVETVFLAASPDCRHIAASLVRQIAAMGGDITPFVPPSVAKALQGHFAKTR